MKYRNWRNRANRFILVVGVTISVTGLGQEPAETTDPEAIEKRFREALFAEEGERNLEKAEEGYREVLERYGDLRKMAATAAFRLGECYRKRANVDRGQSLEDRAARQFEQVIREFPEMTALVKLSRENLAAMGKPLPKSIPVETNDPEAKEIARLEKLFQTSPDRVTELPTPLYEAARTNQFKVAKFLIGKNVNLERGGETGQTPLAKAAEGGNLEMVKLLLEAGADIDGGSSPALHGAIFMDFEKTINALIAAGANLNKQNGLGRSPIGTALESQRLPEQRRVHFVRLLAEAGADLSAIASDRSPPLHFAIKEELPGVVGFLLEQGIDPNTPHPKSGNVPLIEAIKQEEIVKLLIEAGADVNRLPGENAFEKATPLACAAMVGNAEAARMLIGAGADVNAVAKPGGMTPLHFAVGQHAPSASRGKLGPILLEAGADPLAWTDVADGIRERIPLWSLLSRESSKSLLVEAFYLEALASLPKDRVDQDVWLVMPRSLPANTVMTKAAPREQRIPGLAPVVAKETPADPPPRLSEVLVSGFSRPVRSAFPDGPNLADVRILRRKAADGDAGGFTVEVIDFARLVATGDLSKDPLLSWGDIVWIHEDRKAGDSWRTFEEPVREFVREAFQREVIVRIGETEAPFTVDLAWDNYTADWVLGDYVVPNRREEGGGDWNDLADRFRDRFDLDLSKAKLIREFEGQREEWEVNLQSVDKVCPRIVSGDILEIPKRDVADPEVVEKRMNAIWISRPEDGYLRVESYRPRHKDRPGEGVALGLVLAAHFTGSFVPVIPYPDFGRLTIRIPGDAGAAEFVETVSLPESADRMIPWGAIIEIPRVAKSDPRTWTGLSAEQKAMLSAASEIRVTLAPEGLEPREIVAGYDGFSRQKRLPGGRLEKRSVEGGMPKPFLSGFLRDVIESSKEGPKWNRDGVKISGEDGETIDEYRDVPLREGDWIELPRAL